MINLADKGWLSKSALGFIYRILNCRNPYEMRGLILMEGRRIRMSEKPQQINSGWEGGERINCNCCLFGTLTDDSEIVIWS